MVNRVSTTAYQTQDLRNMSLVQTDLATLNAQISSGNKATTYQQLNGQVEEVSGYNTQIAALTSYTANNNGIVTTNLNTQDNTLTSLQSVASNYIQLLTNKTNAATGVSSAVFVQEAQSYLSQITSDLNTQDATGNYVFGGSKTNIAPVATPVPGAATDSDGNAVVSNNYYQGDDNSQTVRISATQTINYGITAGDPAFQNLIGSMQMAIAAVQAGGNPPSTSSDLADSAVQGMAALQATVGANEQTVKDAVSDAGTIQTYLQSSLSDDTSTDIASASIQLSTDQTVLQATYQAFASISKLNLTSFLTT